VKWLGKRQRAESASVTTNDKNLIFLKTLEKEYEVLKQRRVKGK